ncbi:ATP-binding protein [Rhodococcus sp. NPDC058481]|uniref:ATP-binding protein n=1 Tax=unclassified Rhodococcus (in: high G+C Gram-positive bacteria) TaxID=192944 RepID=UPI003653366C
MAKHKNAAAVDPAARIKVLTDEELAALEHQAASASGFKKAWLTKSVERQYNRRATIERLQRARRDGFDREVARLDSRGFMGAGGGRMSTIMPPVEYRGTAIHVAGLYPGIVGANAPILGTPLGQHLKTGAPVCFDPLAAWKAKAITAPSCFICALNGFGKSTLLRRIALGDIAAGTRVIWPGDVKPDGRELTEAVGGQVLEAGYGGIGVMNPLDPGPIGDAIATINDADATAPLEFALFARQLNLVSALAEIVRRSPLKDFEETLLSSAIRLLYAPTADGGMGFDRHRPAILDDLIAVIEGSHPELMGDAVADTVEEYRDQIKPLLRSLRALVKGRFGEVFNGQSSVRFNVNAPSICLDVSSVPDGDTLMRGAVLLAGWSEAFATIEAAHALADADLGPNLAFHVLMDEFWQVLQCGPMMVARIDAVQRLQRVLGVAITAVTHSIAEMESAGALGFVERSRARIIGPVTQKELERLSTVIQFSETEKSMIVGWSDTASSTQPIEQRKRARRLIAATKARLVGARAVDDDGEQAKPKKVVAAGTGMFVLKLGEARRPGIPFKVWVPPIEEASGIHDTDKRLNAANKEREKDEVAA